MTYSRQSGCVVRGHPARRRWGGAALLVLSMALLMASTVRLRPVRVQAAEQTTPPDPDAVCAQCHAAIYNSYKQTAMARGSGPASAGLIPGHFTDSSSGVEYRVEEQDGTPLFTFQRVTQGSKGALQGQHELSYFVGSGRHGRTYLYQQEGLWFELPVNSYTRRARWDMAPAYSNLPEMPPSLPTDSNCLHCHATGVESVATEPRNRFTGAPFQQGGIGCVSCHGDPSAHLAAAGHAAILNPNKLSPERRDSACIQCHLEGDAVVYRPGRSLAQFRPGERLSDTALYFVRASQASGGSRASSQYEALLQSACKRGSGDRLTCTTCHDPHSSPAPAERVAFYRAKCLACHTSPALATTHHPEQPDCASCHMPSRSTADISHEQVTDHNIERHPASQQTQRRPGDLLMAVGGAPATDRDFGLAYAQLAQHGDQRSGERALQLLRRADLAESPGVTAGSGAPDPQLALNLAFLEQLSGDPRGAEHHYETALKADPNEPSALSNLAVLEARKGYVPRAIALLSHLIDRDPSQTGAGLNLALLQCAVGQPAEAKATVLRLEPFNPDLPALKAFLQHGCTAAR